MSIWDEEETLEPQTSADELTRSAAAGLSLTEAALKQQSEMFQKQLQDQNERINALVLVDEQRVQAATAELTQATARAVEQIEASAKAITAPARSKALREWTGTAFLIVLAVLVPALMILAFLTGPTNYLDQVAAWLGGFWAPADPIFKLVVILALIGIPTWAAYRANR